MSETTPVKVFGVGLPLSPQTQQCVMNYYNKHKENKLVKDIMIVMNCLMCLGLHSLKLSRLES